MILDSEQQRQFLLELFSQVNFPGGILELAYTMKTAVTNASLLKDTPEKVLEQ